MRWYWIAVATLFRKAVPSTITTPGGCRNASNGTAEGGWGVFQSGFEAREAGMHVIQIQCPWRTVSWIPASRSFGLWSRKSVNPAVGMFFAKSASPRGRPFYGGIGFLIDQISVSEPKPIELRFRCQGPPMVGRLLLIFGGLLDRPKVYGMV